MTDKKVQSSSSTSQPQTAMPQPAQTPPPYIDPFRAEQDGAASDIYGDPMDIDAAHLEFDRLSNDSFGSDLDSAAEDLDAEDSKLPPHYQSVDGHSSPPPIFQSHQELIPHPSIEANNRSSQQPIQWPSHPSAPTPTQSSHPLSQQTNRPSSSHPFALGPISSSPTRTTAPTRNVLTKPNAWAKEGATGQRGAASRAPQVVEMCVICNERPQFRNGSQSYPTCGNTCARKLKDLQNLPGQTMRGQMGNPNRGGSSRTTFSSDFETNLFGTRLSGQSSSSRMCEVCKERPRVQRGGKIYPTCGLTCAAKLHPPGTVEMCDYCKQRPKVVINGKTFPQCGRTCRDKANAAGGITASCTTCIVCWKASTNPPSDFCSKVCAGVVDHRAPFLLEVPRGHVSFKSVADAFSEAWKNAKRPSPGPSVKKVFMICMKPAHVAKYEEYGTKVNSHALFKKKGNEQRRWIGAPRDCGFGDPGNTTPCTSTRCLVCCLVRSSYTQAKFPDGVLTTSLPRAVEISSNIKWRTSRVVIMTSVLLGRPITMQYQELVEPLPPRGADSVHIIGYKPNGGKLDLDEYIVYDGDAIRPLYMMSYD